MPKKFRVGREIILFSYNILRRKQHQNLKIIYRVYYMTSYPIPTRNSHISPRAESLRADMGWGLIWGMVRKMSYNNLFITYFLLLICASSPADILNSSFSNNVSAAVAAIDTDKKTNESYLSQNNMINVYKQIWEKIWKNNSGERTI